MQGEGRCRAMGEVRNRKGGGGTPVLVQKN